MPQYTTNGLSLRNLYSFWARTAAAQNTMGRRLESQASPRWATRLFNLQNAPRREPSGAALRGGGEEPHKSGNALQD